MRLIDYQPRGLTPSQWRNLAALVAGGLLTLNEHWPQVVAVVGLHYHGLPIPPGITLILQVTALAVTSLSRALNRAKSGTGTGIVGTPADAPILVPAVNDTLVAGGTPLRASSGGFAGLTPSDVSGFVSGLAAALAAYASPPPVVEAPPAPRPVNVTITADAPLEADVLQAAHAALDARAAPDAQARRVEPLPDDWKTASTVIEPPTNALTTNALTTNAFTPNPLTLNTLPNGGTSQ